MDLFSTEDYKEFLRHQIQINANERGYQSRLAQAVGCQRSYLSQVTNGHVHFTPEHAFKVALYWKFDSLETDYFCELVNLERTDFLPLKNRIRKQLKSLKDERDNLNTDLLKNTDSRPTANELAYFANWFTTAIHLATAIPKLQNLDTLAESLHLPPTLVRETLKKLEQWGGVTRDGNKWVMNPGHTHLSKNSDFAGLGHSQWRQKAMLNENLKDPESLHYTSLQSHSIEDYLAIKKILNQSIKQGRKVIHDSKDEMLSCVCIDFFKIL